MLLTFSGSLTSSDSWPSETSAQLSTLSTELASLATKNCRLEKDLDSLKCDYANAVHNYEDALLKIKFLEQSNISVKKEVDSEKVIKDLEHELKNLRMENNMYQEKIVNQDEEICDLNEIIKTNRPYHINLLPLNNKLVLI